MSTEPTQDTATMSQAEAPRDVDTLSLQDDIRNGTWLESKWWGFHVHFNHASIRALVALGGDRIVSLISDLVGHVFPAPLGDVAGLIVQLRWDVMKAVDQQTGNGAKLTSPWLAPGMLIPTARGEHKDLLYWKVYGDPQDTAVYDYPPENFVLDAAGGAWGDHQKFPGNRSAEGASLAVYNSALYCVHRGSPDKYLWYSTYDGEKNWSEGVSFPGNPSSNSNPSVATYRNGIHCVFLGMDNGLYYKVFNGSSWGSHTKIVNTVAEGSALAVYNDRLHCVFRGSDNALYHKVLDGSSWGGHTKIVNTVGQGAALAVYKNRLHCVFRGSDNALYHKVLDGSSWAGHSPVGSSAGNGPALAVYKDNLHCVFRGRDDKKLYHKFFNGSSWSGHTNLGTTADGQPGLAVYHDKHTNIAQLFCVFRGA
ncbi:hypothetical protein ACLMAL_37810 [Nocardia sp. CWNU-33]|uniref:hypothetical protein n=1 Tax=Nocardia sp. CWNU-33 TaxID=3392117 RepID=UPI00398EF771